MNRLRNLTLVVFALTLTLAAVARGQAVGGAPLAERMPADPVLYVGWAGSENVEKLYDGTHAQAVLAASNFDDVFNRFVPALLDKLAEQDPQAREVVSGVKSLGPILWMHPTGLAFGGFDFDAAGGEPMPRLVLTCDAGPDAGRLRAKLTDVFTRANHPEMATLIREQDGRVSLVVGYADLDLAAAAADAGKSFAGSAAFKQTFADLSPEPVYAVYADVPRLLEIVREFVKRDSEVEGDAEGVRDAEIAISGLGLEGIGRSAITGGFEGKMYETRGLMSVKARQGLLRLLPAGPLDEKTLAAVPADATMVAAGQLDLRELLEVVKDSLVRAEPDLAEQWPQLIGFVNAMAGTDVENELLARFGKTWAGYVSPTVGSGVFSGVLVNRPDDPAKLANAFARASTNATILANQKIREQTEGNVTLPGRMLETDAGNLYVLNLPFLAPCWAVDKDAGLARFGFFPQSILSAKAGDAGAFAESDKWEAMREKLGVKQPPAALQYADLPALVNQSYPMLLMTSQTAFGGADLFAEKLGIRPPVMVLPPLAELRKEVEPSGAVLWVGEDGLHFKGTEPFPLSGVLATDTQSLQVQQYATMISVLLPSLNRARDAANKVKSGSNLRQIGMGMRQYAIDDVRAGKYPPDLRTLFLKSEGDLAMDVFVNPRTNTQLPQMMVQSREAQADWVEANSDYVYLAGGMTDSAPSTVPLAYEDPAKIGDNPDGVNVLYADGSVRFIPLAMLQQDLRRNVQYRQQRNLPIPDALK